jgi:Protein of unknown function (DUF2511)
VVVAYLGPPLDDWRWRCIDLGGMRFCAGAAALVLVVTACGSAQQQIKAKDFGPTWPFTVKSGMLRCDARRSVTLVTAGKTYAVNLRAQRRAAAEGWRDVAEIWATGPPMAGLPGKKNIGPVNAFGAELCDSGRRSVAVSGTPARLLTPTQVRRWVKEQQAYLGRLDRAQQDAYTQAFIDCNLTFFTGRIPNPRAAGAKAAAVDPETRAAATKGCSDAFSGPPKSVTAPP